MISWERDLTLIQFEYHQKPFISRWRMAWRYSIKCLSNVVLNTSHLFPLLPNCIYVYPVKYYGVYETTLPNRKHSQVFKRRQRLYAWRRRWWRKRKKLDERINFLGAKQRKQNLSEIRNNASFTELHLWESWREDTTFTRKTTTK